MLGCQTIFDKQPCSSHRGKTSDGFFGRLTRHQLDLLGLDQGHGDEGQDFDAAAGHLVPQPLEGGLVQDSGEASAEPPAKGDLVMEADLFQMAEKVGIELMGLHQLVCDTITDLLRFHWKEKYIATC